MNFFRLSWLLLFLISLCSPVTAQIIIPRLIETYEAPNNAYLYLIDKTSSDTLVLVTSSVGFDKHLSFDPATEGFSIEDSNAYYGLGSGEVAWDNNAGTFIAYDMAYTGWADFCPDGIYYHNGWGGTSLYFGNGPQFDYNREIWGVTTNSSGEILLMAGTIMNPCLDSEEFLEIVKFTSDGVNPTYTYQLTLAGAESLTSWSNIRGLDYDEDNDLYWVTYSNSEVPLFIGYSSSGEKLYEVLAPGYEARLVHWQDLEYFIVDGSSTLRHVEIDLLTSVDSWKSY